MNAHVACKVGNWWTSVVFTTERVGIQRECRYSIVYRRWLCIGLSNSRILRLTAQYFSFCSQMEIDKENREECRTRFIRGLYQDLHKKYEDALAKNAELVKLTTELWAENERLHCSVSLGQLYNFRANPQPCRDFHPLMSVARCHFSQRLGKQKYVQALRTHPADLRAN